MAALIPEMRWRPHIPFADTILRHPALDCATLQVDEEGTIDDPQDTIEPALAMRRLVSENIRGDAGGTAVLRLRARAESQFQGQEDPCPRPSTTNITGICRN